MTTEIGLILHRQPFFLIYSGDGIHFFVFAKDYIKKYGKTAWYNLAHIKKYAVLGFEDGSQETDVLPIRCGETNELELNAKALFQLVIAYASTQSDLTFQDKDLKLFFEGSSLNSAERYFQYVGRFILAGTPLDELPNGSMQRYSVARDRKRYAEFWRDIGVPVKLFPDR